MARAAAQAKWGDSVPLRSKILELREGEDCIVIGTMFKDMPLKPSILDEYAKDRGISSAVLGRRASFVSPEDTLLLEGMRFVHTRLSFQRHSHAHSLALTHAQTTRVASVWWRRPRRSARS